MKKFLTAVGISLSLVGAALAQGAPPSDAVTLSPQEYDWMMNYLQDQPIPPRLANPLLNMLVSKQRDAQTAAIRAKGDAVKPPEPKKD